MKNAGKLMMLVMLGAAVVAAASVRAEDKAPKFKLPSVSGEEHSLEQYKGKLVVLEWTNYDCPFVRKFYKAGVMQGLQEKYTGKGIVWLSVCSSAPGKQGNFSRDVWRRRMEDAQVKATVVLLDEGGDVGKAYGAKNTPHMFVIDKDGKIAYQGAIDDKRSVKVEELKDARNYVAEALDSLLAEKPIEVVKTKPYGCSVKY